MGVGTYARTPAVFANVSPEAPAAEPVVAEVSSTDWNLWPRTAARPASRRI
jgi:hypothetical protein